MLDDIKKTLWAAADKLHANMDGAEYKHPVRGTTYPAYIAGIRVNLGLNLSLAGKRDTLLPRLISGQLRPREATAAVDHALATTP